MSHTDSNQNLESDVSHLVELGYVDPQEIIAARALEYRHREEELRRAREASRAGRLDEARTLLRNLADSDPDSIGPRLLLAEIYFRTGDSTLLDQQLDWLACHSVVTPRLAMLTAAVSLQRRNGQAALFDLEYACHVAPTLPGAQTLLAIAHTRLARWDQAEAAFTEAIRQNPKDARALDGLSAIALHRKDFVSAADFALRALGQDMQLAGAHYHLGAALIHLDRPAPAAEAFAICTRLDSSRAAPYYWLSRIATECGDSTAASEYRRRAREIIDARRVKLAGTSTQTQPA